MVYTFKTKGTCSTKIQFDLDGGVVSDIRFHSGCDGNLKAISALLDGCEAGYLLEKCTGLRCGRKATSCADQLAKAVQAACEQENKKTAG